MFGGVIAMTQSNLTIIRSQLYNNIAPSGGGVLNSQQSSSVVIRESIFSYNVANTGGVLMLSYINHATIIGSIFTYNKAPQGGTLTGVRIQLMLHNAGLSDNQANSGGALYFFQGDVTFSGVCILIRNIAENGGAIHATETKLNVFEQTRVLHNVATHTGGGVFLYHSELNCHYQSILEVIRPATTIYGVTYFERISDKLNINAISSGPVQLYFCTLDRNPDCSFKRQFVQVMKGKDFTLPVVAVDQVNHTVMNVSILKYPDSGLGEGQITQTTDGGCTALTFSIYSLSPSEEVTLYAEGPCGNVSESQITLFVTFRNCSCLIGFQPKTSKQTDCECGCDSNLPSYITECNSQNEAIIRDSNYWITYFNNTGI